MSDKLEALVEATTKLLDAYGDLLVDYDEVRSGDAPTYTLEATEAVVTALTAIGPSPEPLKDDAMEVARETCRQCDHTGHERRRDGQRGFTCLQCKAIAQALVAFRAAGVREERERVMWWFDEMVHRIHWADSDAEHMSVLRDRLRHGSPTTPGGTET